MFSHIQRKELYRMKTTIDLQSIKEQAETYYRNGDFYCSEAVVKTIKDGFNLPFDDEIIKLASGFPVGIGGMGCTCGAISGGVLAIGLVFGRSVAKDPAVTTAMELSAQLYKLFIENHKTSCCKALTATMELGSVEHLSQCITLTGEVAYETARIIGEKLELEMTY